MEYMQFGVHLSGKIRLELLVELILQYQLKHFVISGKFGVKKNQEFFKGVKGKILAELIFWRFGIWIALNPPIDPKNYKIS